MDVTPFVAKFLLGGALVCVFALISEACAPKRFAGLFSAAPSVLVAGLAVTLVSKTAGAAMLTAEGAVAGGVGMVAYGLVSAPAIRRLKALPGSTLSVGVWLVVSFGVYAVLKWALGW